MKPRRFPRVPIATNVALQGVSGLEAAITERWQTLIINAAVGPAQLSRELLQARRARLALYTGIDSKAEWDRIADAGHERKVLTDDQYRKYLTGRLQDHPKYSNEWVRIMRLLTLLDGGETA